MRRTVYALVSLLLLALAPASAAALVMWYLLPLAQE